MARLYPASAAFQFPVIVMADQGQCACASARDRRVRVPCAPPPLLWAWTSSGGSKSNGAMGQAARKRWPRRQAPEA